MNSYLRAGLCTSLLLSGVMQGQITLDVTNVFTWEFGMEIVRHRANDSLGVAVDVGSEGSGQFWNFDVEDYPDGAGDTLRMLDPGAADFPDPPPEADVLIQIKSPEGYDRFSYTDIAKLGVFFPRWVQISPIPPGSTGELDTIVADYDPPFERIRFPATLGSSWDQVTASSFAFSVDDDDFLVIDSVTLVNEVDASGQVETPAGTFDCLRLQSDETHNRLVYVNGELVNTEIESNIIYTWMGEMHPFLAEIKSLEGETNPDFTLAGEVAIQTELPMTGIGDGPAHAARTFSLSQNYPNPFNPSTSVELGMQRAEWVSLKIFDPSGRVVKTLVEGRIGAGQHLVTWNATDADDRPVASGVYYYELRTRQASQTRKMILLR